MGRKLSAPLPLDLVSVSRGHSYPGVMAHTCQPPPQQESKLPSSLLLLNMTMFHHSQVFFWCLMVLSLVFKGRRSFLAAGHLGVRMPMESGTPAFYHHF